MDTKSGGSKNRSSPCCFQCTTLRECKILVLVGMCRPVPKSRPYFKPPPQKNGWHPFSDLASKTFTHSQTWSLRNEVIISYIRTETEIFLKIHFELAYFSLFFSYSFGIETINTFVNSRSSLQIHTRFQACRRKWAKSLPVLKPKGRKTI